MTDTLKDALEPLFDPTEMAGTADAAIAAEFAARDAIEARDGAEALEPANSEEVPLDGE